MNEHTYGGGPHGRPRLDLDHDPFARRRRRRPDDFGDDRRRGSGRMRRGDVRNALLIALLDGPGHGYELIQALETKTDGRWRPSPGSVYPSLQLLADEDLVRSTEVDGKRTFELTDAGRTHAEEHLASHGNPWDAMDRGRTERGDLRTAVRDLVQAAKQVGFTGSPETVQQATDLVQQARKDLYRLLAES